MKIDITGTDDKAVKNFINMVYSKQYLINKAVGGSTIDISEDTINKLQKEKSLKGLKLNGIYIGDDAIEIEYKGDADKAGACAEVLKAAFNHCRDMIRTLPADYQQPENEKYYMRVWLLQIGFVGKSGAEVRKLMAKNLGGYTSYRTKEEQERATARHKAKRSSDVK